MSEISLTATEIYEIDKLNDFNAAEYLKKLSPEKRVLASHVYAKNRALRVMGVLVDERDEGNRRLIKLLKDNGVEYA